MVIAKQTRVRERRLTGVGMIGVFTMSLVAGGCQRSASQSLPSSSAASKESSIPEVEIENALTRAENGVAKARDALEDGKRINDEISAVLRNKREKIEMLLAEVRELQEIAD